MDTKRDIETRADIEHFILAFYEKVRKDETIGVIFNEVVKMDWNHHIPIIVDFWETILLDADLYRKNAMEPHFAINQKYPLQPVHFQKWLELFTGTISESFEGPIATLAVTRAKGIAGVMQLKMDAINKNRQS
jgi:hemoglobin